MPPKHHPAYATALLLTSLLTACNTTSTKPDTPAPTAATAKPGTCTILDGYTAQDELMLGPPLSFAVSSNNLPQAECLLKMGKDANAPDGTGTTPLVAAINQGNTTMVRLLLKHGANPNTVRHWEKPLDVARAKGNPTIIKLLENAGASSENDRARRESAEREMLDRMAHRDMQLSPQEAAEKEMMDIIMKPN